MLILLLLLLLTPAWGQDLEYFAPSDHSFRLQLPGPIRQVRAEDDMLIWGSSSPTSSYLFGYSVIPRAATLRNEKLNNALADYLQSFMESAGCKCEPDPSLTRLDGHEAVQRLGRAPAGISRARALAVGPRVFIVECTGVSAQEAERYFQSFKLQ